MRSGLRRDVVTASAIAAVLQYGTFGLTYAFLPVYAQDIGATEFDLGLLTTAVVAAGAMAALVLAFVGDRVHAQSAIVVGFLMAALSATLVPFIGDLGMLTAMGVFQAVYALGMFLGPATSCALAEWLGLDRVFLVFAAMSVVGALAAAHWLGRDERALEATAM